MSYSVSATDIADPAPRLTCGPSSNSTFPIGITAVACTASDASGNSVSGSFRVTVRGAAEQLADLILMVEDFNRPKSPGKKFEHELNKASDALRGGNVRKACQELDKFIKAVLKESGGKLTAGEAAQLLAAAKQVRAVISC